MKRLLICVLICVLGLGTAFAVTLGFAFVLGVLKGANLLHLREGWEELACAFIFCTSVALLLFVDKRKGITDRLLKK